MTHGVILMVDDEPELITAMAERMTLRGYTVETATNGEDALRRIAPESHSLLLVDLKMPGLGGLDVLREARRIDPELPVVLFTGHTSQADAERGIKLGAAAYLVKPVDFDSLIATVERSARIGRARES